MIRVDILIPTAYQGGVENVINRTCLYLMEKGIAVRVIQIVGDGSWCDSSISKYIVSKEARVFTVNEIGDSYHTFIEKEGIPDLVLCAVWPVMTRAARMAINQYYAKKSKNQEKKKPQIISWMHHGSVAYLEAAGWGNYADLSFADAHLAINQYLVQEIQENIPNAKVYRITNPVDFSKYQNTKKTKKNPDHEKLQVIYVGRISSEKRLDVILKAFSKVKNDCELHIVGSTPGEYEDAIHKFAEELNIAENIKWYSWMENPWSFVKNMDICVMASDLEGFPLVAIEALANGLPVLSTPAEGMEELIFDGINGYLYPFEDDETLSKLLWAIGNKKLPEMEPERCMQSVQKYDVVQSLDNFFELLRSLL